MVVSPTAAAAAEGRLRPPFSWRRLLRRRLPILGWLPDYDRSAAVSDAIAGTTSGLTMIAQAIAYAALAELPAQYGLYSAFVGSLVYVLLGTIEAVSIGPSSLNALLTLQYTVGRPIEYVVVLTFLCGVVQFLMAVLQLGFVVDFISVPVTTAFMSATVIIIVTSQLKNFMGISFSSSRFLDTFSELYRRFGNSVAGDMWLSLGCCSFLLAIKGLQYWRWDERTARGRRCKSWCWYLGILSNGLLVLFTSVMAYVFAAMGNADEEPAAAVPFRLSGNVTSGLPPFRLPPFQFENSHNETVHFMQIVSDLGSGVLVVPLVALLSNVAIGKSLATGRTVDTSQEMMTLGVCNMAGSFFSSMPTGGAFTRSAVIRSSGVRTPMHGAYSAAVIVLALTLLTPYFYYIPRASLAAVLVVSVVFMIDFRMPLRLWRNHRSDFWSYVITFTVSLAVGVELGLSLGILCTLARLLYLWARPQVQRTVCTLPGQFGQQYIEVDARTGMFYPSADWLRDRTIAAAGDAGFTLPVVLQCERFAGLDYTSSQALSGLAKDLAAKGGGKAPLVLVALRSEFRRSLAAVVNMYFVESIDELETLLQCRERVDGSGALTAADCEIGLRDISSDRPN